VTLEENEKLFEEVKGLKLENFQQSVNLRQSLWKEFSDRFSVIQEEHRSVCLYMCVAKSLLTLYSYRQKLHDVCSDGSVYYVYIYYLL